jgi:hypothetical protein
MEGTAPDLTLTRALELNGEATPAGTHELRDLGSTSSFGETSALPGTAGDTAGDTGALTGDTAGLWGDPELSGLDSTFGDQIGVQVGEYLMLLVGLFFLGTRSLLTLPLRWQVTKMLLMPLPSQLRLGRQG